jgi:hypothetical protein
MAQVNLDDALAGFLLPDPLMTLDELQPVAAGVTGSSYTQAGPVPGVPVYQYGAIGRSSTTAGDLGPQVRLQVIGEQSQALDVMCTRAGMPGTGMEVAVRRELATGETHWQGKTTEQVLQQLSVASLDRGIDSAANWNGCDLQNGQALVVWQNSGIIYGRRYDAATHDWSGPAVVIADHTRAMNADGAQPDGAGYVNGHPVDVIRLPTGRLLVAAFVLGPAAGVDLVVHYSDDDALTWRSLTLAGYDVELPAGATYDGLSWHHTHELVLLLVSVSWLDEQTTYRGWVQYASSDIGHSFTLVESWNDGTPGQTLTYRPDITSTTDGIFVVAYVAGGIGSRRVYVRRSASPYIPLRDVDAVDVSGLVVSVADDVCCWSDPAGYLYVAWQEPQRLRIARSLDGGVSWDDFDTDLTFTPGGNLDRFRAIPIGSRLLWTVQDTATGARPDQWLALVESGGWTMLPMPRTEAGHPYELRAFGGAAGGLDAVTWMPVNSPTGYGWTLTGTAGLLAITGSFALVWSSAVGEYARAFGSHAVEDGIVVHWECETSATPIGYGSQGVGIEVDLGNGVADMRVDVRITNAGVGLYDVNGAALIGSDAIDCTVRRVWRLGLRYGGAGNTVSLYSRLSTDDVWRLHVTGTATRRTTGGTTTAVRWGHVGASANSSTWYALHVAVGDGFGTLTATTDSLAAGLVLAQAPDTLQGAALPSMPNRLHIDGQTYLRGRGGPGARGDQWQCPIGYLYPVSNIATRSPQREHRTTADGVSVDYVWAPRGGTVEHHAGGHALGIAVFGANWRQCKLQGGDGTSWTDIAALDLADGLTGLSYTRDGDTIRVAGGATASYLRPLDLIGGTVAIGSDRYRIVGATPGVWRAGSAAVTLQVDGAPAGTASGTLDIWRTAGAAVALGYQTAHRYYRWRIAPETTADGFYRVGRFVAGQVVVLGQRWSRGRSVAYVPQVDLQTVPGDVSARKLAGMQRRQRVSWSEGFPTYWGDDPSYQSAGGVPVAMIGDLSPVETLTAQTGGGLSSVVLLPRIPYDPAAVSVETVQCIGREMTMLCYLVGDVEVEDIDGDEAADAVQRVASVELVEEV